MTCSLTIRGQCIVLFSSPQAALSRFLYHLLESITLFILLQRPLGFPSTSLILSSKSPLLGPSTSQSLKERMSQGLSLHFSGYPHSRVTPFSVKAQMPSMEQRLPHVDIKAQSVPCAPDCHTQLHLTSRHLHLVGFCLKCPKPNSWVPPLNLLHSYHIPF